MLKFSALMIAIIEQEKGKDLERLGQKKCRKLGPSCHWTLLAIVLCSVPSHSLLAELFANRGNSRGRQIKLNWATVCVTDCPGVLNE